MKLFFDENIGGSVPKALFAVGRSRGVRVDYPGRTRSRTWGRRIGSTDEQWITHIGKSGFLGISCNTKILANDEEREVILRESAGIVFLNDSAQEDSITTLQLILGQLDWLLWIHKEMPRPFAINLGKSGHKKVVIGDEEIANSYEPPSKRRKIEEETS